MAASQIIEKKCRACMSRYSVLQRRTTLETRGELTCEVCGETFFTWNSRVTYTQCDLVYRGSLDSRRPNRFGPSRREVEGRFRDE